MPYLEMCLDLKSEVTEDDFKLMPCNRGFNIFSWSIDLVESWRTLMARKQRNVIYKIQTRINKQI